MTDLQDAVKLCVSRLDRYRQQGRRIGEQNTKAGLIEPIIDVLGWDIYDPDEVHREYRRRSTDNPVDYALLLSETPRLFIEAKGFGENLDDPRWANQTIGYATVAGVEWVALTDGAEWRVYNAHALVPVEQKLFRAVRLEDDFDGAVELLALLSKEGMRANRLEQLWQDFFVGRQVHEALAELFTGDEPNPEFVALLHRRLPRLTAEDIRSSLMRSRATFDFPAASQPPPRTDRTPATPATPATPPATPATPPAAPATQPPVPMSAATSAAGRSQPARTTISDEERRVRISDMIAVGRLRPGQLLYGRYFGQQYTAELRPDGSILHDRKVYGSPSAAGVAVKVSVHGADAPSSKTATDGLDFWHTKDALSGDLVPLKVIRRRTVTGSNR